MKKFSPERQRPESFELDHQHPLACGLVFAGLGQGNRSATFRDSSLYGGHGLLTGMSPGADWAWIPQLGRWALTGFSATEYVQFPAALNVFPTSAISGSLTVAFWAYISTLDTLPCAFSWAGTDDFLMYLGKTTDGTRVYWRDLGGVLLDVAGDRTGDWHHYLFYATNGKQELYIDGANAASGSASAATSGIGPFNNFRIGHYGDGTAQNFLYGRMSDFLCWKTDVRPYKAILANRADPMLSGLILPPRRRLWASAAAPAATKYWTLHSRSRVIGGGVT